MAKEYVSKTTFCCPRFVGLFEWVVMTFSLMNAGATYVKDRRRRPEGGECESIKIS
jgi:hypothetical protein